MKNEKKIIFFDIDGTLVDFEGRMPESTKRALDGARKNGHKLVLCTGRNKCQIYDWLMEYGFDGMVCAAGAYVEYGGEVISHSLTKRESLSKLIDYFEKEHIIYGLQCADHMVATPSGVEGMARMLKTRFSADEEQISRIFKMTLIEENPRNHTDIEKMIYYESPVGLAEVKKALSPDFEVTAASFEKPDDRSGEVTVTGINKAYGMRKLIEHLGMWQQDTVAIGDGPNDLDMLQYAAVGIAMGNAGDYVKASADLVTDSINEDGIYHALNRLKLI